MSCGHTWISGPHRPSTSTRVQASVLEGKKGKLLGDERGYKMVVGKWEEKNTRLEGGQRGAWKN